MTVNTERQAIKTIRAFFPRSGAVASLSIAMALALPGLGGCTPRDQTAAASSEAIPRERAKPVMLAITGYNYTNRHIGSFSVNGQGGGNLYVSTPTSGGGSSACCVPYTPGNAVRKVTVEWQSGGCYFHEKSTISNEVYDTLHSFSHAREVEVESDVQSDPKVLEVHFYPDGSIRAAITRTASAPRFRLDANREDKLGHPRCPNDQKPAA